MRYLLFLLLLTLLGCEGKKEGEFSEEELSWLVYDEGDTILYKGNKNLMQALVVNHRTDLSQIRNYYPIEAEVEMFGPDSEEKFRIYLLKDEETFKKYLKVGEVYRSFDFVEPIDSVQVNNLVYNQVYIFTEDTTESHVPVWRVYYNQESGIIKYLKRNGSFELISPAYSN